MSSATLFQFPCDFPIKVFCQVESNELDGMLAQIHTIVTEQHIVLKSLQTSKSQNGRYHCMTLTIIAENQGMVDKLYQTLCKLPECRMVL